jgi:hypothetical protein
MRTVALRVIVVFLALLGLLPLVPAQDVNYHLRTNRYEGLRDLQYAGEAKLRLLSFIAYYEPVRLADQPVLKVRFFLPRTGSVFITAVELRRQGRSHYQMRPARTDWNAGWQEFSPWPTADVLVPLQISPDNLGVVARLDSEQDGGSGAIAPVIVYAGRYPQVAARYVAQFLPPSTLAKVDYDLINVDAGTRVASGRLCEETPGQSKPCVAGNTPFEIAVDLSGQPSGNYRLVIDTRVYDHASGPSQQYFFWHEAKR